MAQALAGMCGDVEGVGTGLGAPAVNGDANQGVKALKPSNRVKRHREGQPGGVKFVHISGILGGAVHVVVSGVEGGGEGPEKTTGIGVLDVNNALTKDEIP